MEIVCTADFEKSFTKLPVHVKRLYSIQEKRFLARPNDSRLHLKKLHALSGVFSFRITQQYRVLFYFHTEHSVIFFAIGHRKDIYR